MTKNRIHDQLMYQRCCYQYGIYCEIVWFICFRWNEISSCND